MGVLAGSVTLTGGPATGLAFAPLFEQAGVTGAATLAVAAAMVGIVAGGVIGGPISTFLVERIPHRVKPTRATPGTLENLAEQQVAEPVSTTPAGEDVESYILLKHLVVMLVTVGLGLWVSALADARGTDAACLHWRDARRRGLPQHRRPHGRASASRSA